MTNATAQPAAMPTILPIIHIIVLSAKNSQTILIFLAPSDFFMPISRFRSPTLTSIAVITDTDATASEIPAVNDSAEVATASIPSSCFFWL